MSKTAVIVQARLGSTRLPAKVLLPLPTGRTVLEEVLWRCAQIEGVDALVLAIPDTPENDILERMTLRKQSSKPITLVRGPEHDVLARYAKAAEAVDADVIMRVTSDCPLIDPEVCGQVLEAYRAARDVHGNVEYCSNSIDNRRTYPQGFDCEVFDRVILVQADTQASDPQDREHVTPWIIRHAEQYRWIEMPNGEDRSHLRWTLDTMEKGPDGMGDYERIWRVFQEQMREAA